MQNVLEGAAILTWLRVILEARNDGVPQMMPAILPPIAVTVRLLMVILRQIGAELVLAGGASAAACAGLMSIVLPGVPSSL